jgi:putative membrane protein
MKQMKMNRLFLAGTLSAVMMLTACEKDEEAEDNVNEQDRTFAVQASMSNRAEIELGNLALTKASNDSVKYYAQLMITEHTQAQDELKAVADDMDLNVDLEQALGAEFTAVQQALTGLDATAFDSVYMRSQVLSHQMTIANFQTEAATGGSENVKAYANKYLPHIQMHLDMANRIHTQVK